MKKLLSTLALITVLAFPSFAQESTQEAPITEGTDISNSTPLEVDNAQTDAPAEAVTWLEQIGFASLLVTSLVAFLKFVPIPAIQGLAPQRVALALNIFIWVIFIVARETGNEQTLITYVTDFGKLSDTALRIVATYLGGASLYHGAKASNMPFLGKSAQGTGQG